MSDARTTAGRLRANDPSLTVLETPSTDSDFLLVVDALMYNTQTTKVIVYSDTLSDNSIRRLARLIEVNECVKTLCLSINDAALGERIRVIDAIAKNATLERVQLAATEMANVEFDAIAGKWKSHPSLKRVDFFVFEAEDDVHASRRIAELLDQSNLTGLGINAAFVTDAFVRAVCTRSHRYPYGMIGRLHSLAIINNCAIDPIDIMPVLQCIKSAGTVKKLRIDDADDTGTVRRMIADMVRTSGSLTKLHLTVTELVQNRPDERAAEAAMLTMIDALKRNKSVRTARFFGMVNSHRIQRALVDMLRANDTLTTLTAPHHPNFAGVLNFFIRLNRAHAAHVNAIGRALNGAWVRANRPGDKREPFSNVPKELVRVIAASTTRDTDPSPLDQWSAAEIAQWERGEVPTDRQATTGTRTMSSGNGAKRVARG